MKSTEKDIHNKNKSKKNKSKKNIARIIYLLFLIIITLGIIFANNFAREYKYKPKKIYKMCTHYQHKKNQNRQNKYYKQYKHLDHKLNQKIKYLEGQNQILFDKYNNLSDKLSKLQNNNNSPEIIISYFEFLSLFKNNQKYQDIFYKLKLLIDNDSKLGQKFLELEELLTSSVKNHQTLTQDFQILANNIIKSNSISLDDNLLTKIKNNILANITIRKINFKESVKKPKIDYLLWQIEENLQNKNYQMILTLLLDLRKIEPELTDNFKLEIEKIIFFQNLNKEIINLLR